jgi:hypothetical protein
MPKGITIHLIIIAMLVSLLAVLGCGSGDKMASPRTELNDIFSGSTGTTDNTTDGGGGATGRCNNVYGVTGACVDTNDFSGLTQSICENNYSGIWQPGLTCP